MRPWPPRVNRGGPDSWLRPIGAGASCRKFFGVVARPEFVQHVLELAYCKYEQALVLVELIHGDRAHPHQIGNVRLHVRIGLGPFLDDLAVSGFGRGLPGCVAFLRSCRRANTKPKSGRPRWRPCC